MSPAASLKTRCPVCNKKYHLPASSAGHRARCSECQTVFRVPRPEEIVSPHDTPIASILPPDTPAPAVNGAGSRGLHPPTEDDIVGWLSQATEAEETSTPAPRIVREAIPVAPSPGSTGSRLPQPPVVDPSKSGAPVAKPPAGLAKTG